MNYVLPRVIIGNRGDLASRWGVLRALECLGERDLVVFHARAGEIPAGLAASLPYGRMRNLLPTAAGWRALRRADVVLWSVGLDMQDDSSLAKLLYLSVLFRLYRALGLRVWCLFQGAGPITTPAGRRLARAALQPVERFVARDPGTYALVSELAAGPVVHLAHDAIFLPGFEADLPAPARSWLAALRPADGRPLIGFNIRQWFHFASRLLPYQFAQRAYRAQSSDAMQTLITAAANLVRELRSALGARIMLISAYEPDQAPWEDDLPWLRAVQAAVGADPEVHLIERPLTLPDYFGVMAQLDLMIGMRLHSALIALRFGVPALNVSYTLKGGAIMRHLGLADRVVELETWLTAPEQLVARSVQMLADAPAERARVQAAVQQAIALNMNLLRTLLTPSVTP